MSTDFAALRSVAIGTSRHFAVVPNDGRDRSEADMPRASRPCGSDQNDLISAIGGRFCCDAQHGTPTYNDVVGCDPRTEGST
jgi:hypothetical protein